MVAQESFPAESRSLYDAVWLQPFDEETRQELDEVLYLAGLEAGMLSGRTFIGSKRDEEVRIFSFEWGALWFDRRPYSTGFSPTSADYAMAYSFGFGKRAASAVRRGAKWVWGTMTDTFSERVAAGEIKILARLASPLAADVTVLSPDAWRQLYVTDWHLGIAACPATADRLFSIHAIDTGRTASRVTRRNPGSEDLAALQAEFVRRRTLGLPPLTVQETIEWARTRNLPRKFARRARASIPDGLKLKAGEKRRDHRPD